MEVITIDSKAFKQLMEKLYVCIQAETTTDGE